MFSYSFLCAWVMGKVVESNTELRNIVLAAKVGVFTLGLVPALLG